jgi:myosin heavy subunit
MKNIRQAICIVALGCLGISATLVAKDKRETAEEKYQRACLAISEIVKQRNELRRELSDLKKRLQVALPGGQGDIIAQIKELEELRAKLKEIAPLTADAENGGLISQMDVVAERLKQNDLLIDLMMTLIPEKIQLEEKTGDREKDLHKRMQLLVGRYNDVSDKMKKLKKQIDSKNSEIRKLRKAHEEAFHYLVKLVDYAHANSETNVTNAIKD